MQITDQGIVVDFYPVGNGEHRFSKRVKFENGQTSFSTVMKIEMKYEVHNRLAKGAEVTGFNVEPMSRNLYSAMMC
jgi:hypothetical protein